MYDAEFESIEEGEEEVDVGGPTVTNDMDEHTVRIMVSTDNHLGYEEKDPVRGNDSFAAFEEVLYLAKRHRCDMVLLAGDLFHDNKPSRRTLYRAMDIIRRYCLGPDPVQFHILSDQRTNFRSTIHGLVNFEDPHYSIDLPIFAIHGNHDDPTRDGGAGTETLAPLDLLAISNLVNYFGRQDEVDKVVVSPVMIQKGSTRVALYGMGSMRDERLNRMWTGGKVRFLEPFMDDGDKEDDNNDDEDDDERQWFHILALHQNRDTGRGSKNCVHEKMIPDFMDLVVWGHEHECRIFPDESAPGTFRITQPGSSVATSLSAGESVRKNVGILDIRGTDFRLMPVPLSQVRSFEIGEVSLQDQAKLNPLDPKIDDKIMLFLAEKVQALIAAAREKNNLVLRDSAVAAGIPLSGNEELDEDQLVSHKLKYRLEKPDQVLVRLKVEHTGFNSINNQRFGARFVEDVANNADILLFHRRKTLQNATAEKKSSKRGQAKHDEAVVPIDLAEIGISELIQESLETANAKLEVLDEERLALALDDFVEKEVSGAFDGTVDKVTTSQQKKLVQRGSDNQAKDGDETKVVTSAAVREICSAQTEKKRLNVAKNVDNVDETRKNHIVEKPKPTKANVVHIDDNDDDEDDDNDNDAKMKSVSRNNELSSKLNCRSTPSRTSAKVADKATRVEDKSSSSRRSYTVLSDDDLDDSDEYLSNRNDDNLVKGTAKSRKTTVSSSRTASSKRKATSDAVKTTAQGKKVAKLYDGDDSDVDGDSHAFGLGKGWGTANSQSQVNKRGRR